MSTIDKNTGVSWEKSCVYAEIERKLYWLTRQIKGLSIDPEQYHRIFQRPLFDDFGEVFTLFEEEGLFNDIPLQQKYFLTKKGCYFADAMAGLLVEYAFSLKEAAQMRSLPNQWLPDRFRKLTRPHPESKTSRYLGNDARRNWMG